MGKGEGESIPSSTWESIVVERATG